MESSGPDDWGHPEASEGLRTLPSPPQRIMGSGTRPNHSSSSTSMASPSPPPPDGADGSHETHHRATWRRRRRDELSRTFSCPRPGKCVVYFCAMTAFLVSVSGT